MVGTEIHNAGHLNCKDNEITRVTTSQPKVQGSNFKFKSVQKHYYLTLSEYVFLFVFITCVCVCVCVCSVVSDSLPLHGLQPASLLCLWNFHIFFLTLSANTYCIYISVMIILSLMAGQYFQDRHSKNISFHPFPSHTSEQGRQKKNGMQE